MKSKIILISFIFILVSCLFINNNVFASTDYIYNNETITLPDLPFDTNEQPYYFICFTTYENRNVYEIAYPNSSFTNVFSRDETYNGFGYYLEDGSTYGQWTYYYCSPDMTYWKSKQQTQSGNLKIGVDGYILYSTFNIYTDDTYSELFFQGTPVTGTLAPVLGKVEMLKPMMKEILTLVPIMITLIASYLGLRKGLTFIKTLRKM